MVGTTFECELTHEWYAVCFLSTLNIVLRPVKVTHLAEYMKRYQNSIKYINDFRSPSTKIGVFRLLLCVGRYRNCTQEFTGELKIIGSFFYRALHPTPIIYWITFTVPEMIKYPLSFQPHENIRQVISTKATSSFTKKSNLNYKFGLV